MNAIKKCACVLAGIIFTAILLSGIFALSTEASAVLRDNFSYSFVINGQTVIVTGLANGKSFMKVNGNLVTPINGVLNKYNISIADATIPPKIKDISFNISNGGKECFIGVGDTDIQISRTTNASGIPGAKIEMVGGKRVYVSQGGFDSPPPERLQDYSYFLIEKGLVLHVYTSSSDGIPQAYKQIVETLARREAKVQ